MLTNNRNVQLALLDRSPSVSVQHLINTLIYMLNNIDPSLPTIVMGDFNEDLCEYVIPSAETLRLLNFMSANG